MKAEHTKIFAVGDRQIKVLTQMFTVSRGIGCEIKYHHTIHSSTDGKYWTPLNADLTPEQQYDVDHELWLQLKPAEPMVTFL